MRRVKRTKREILAGVLGALIEHGDLNKHQLQIHAGLKGRHAKPYIESFLEAGLVDWTGKRSRAPNRQTSEHYAEYLTITERGRAWLKLWSLIQEVEDPTSKIRIGIKDRRKTDGS